MYKIVSFLIICACHIALSVGRIIDLKPNQAIILQLSANELVTIRTAVHQTNVSHLVLHTNALQPVCIGVFRSPCPQEEAFQGRDVGWEQIVRKSSRIEELEWSLHSNTKQSVFVALRGYKKAAVVGACSSDLHKRSAYNPNLDLDLSNNTYSLVSFNYSSVFESDLEERILQCSNDALKNVITYQLYALPFNQRYRQPHPSFDTGSLRSLKQVLNYSSTSEAFNKGILLTSITMDSASLPASIRVSRRIGLDMVLTVAARLLSSDGSESSFYVSHVVWGCTANDNCVLLQPLILKIVVGLFAFFGLIFAHLGRRLHRLNTFFSGYFLGFLVSFILFGRFTALDWVTNLAISLSVCACALGALNCGIFWRAKPNWRTSYMLLYVDASFLIVASMFFTSIGNQPIWREEAVFIGTFYGLVAVLSVLIFPWITDLISVDLCTALVGSFLFVSGCSAIFLPGCVFPFILWDAISRVAEPGSHAALSVFVNSSVDFALFAGWPLLALLISLFNRRCSKPLTPRPEVNPAPVVPVDSWPPLPYDPFSSERAPLLNDRSELPPFATAPPQEPPPYQENPPAYRP